jgi:hypothetical protein
LRLPHLNFEDNDITVWGIAALFCSTLAVFAVNVSALIPDNVVAGLHATRLDGGNANQLRANIVEMRAENVRVTRDYRALLARLNLLNDDSGEVIRRLAAVERSMPLLIESLPLHSDIDRSLLTASIAAASPEVYQADGGVIVVRHSPLFEDLGSRGSLDQPIPPFPDGTGYGVALGDEVLRESAAIRRAQILSQTGPLLSGLTFIMGETGALAYTRIIAGPFPDFEDASVLCEPLDIMGIDCEPVPFEGETWPGR